jgi:hypothetical protein
MARQLALGPKPPSRTARAVRQHFADDEIFSAVVKVFQKPLQHRFNPFAKGDPKPVTMHE